MDLACLASTTKIGPRAASVIPLNARPAHYSNFIAFRTCTRVYIFLATDTSDPSNYNIRELRFVFARRCTEITGRSLDESPSSGHDGSMARDEVEKRRSACKYESERAWTV